jgi:hypothetical protein
MKDSELIVSFYVVQDEIKINHVGNTSEEILREIGSKRSGPILLFKYIPDSKKLIISNIDSDSLTLILESLKDKKQGKSLNSELSFAVKQLQVASKFLRKIYGWEGEVFSKEEVGFDDDIELSVSDFKIVWEYLKFFFLQYNAEVFDIPVHVIDALEEPSFFIEEDEEYGEITGPAICVKKTNSIYSMCESIILQYVLNYDNIIKFDVALREEYLFDAKEHVDAAITGFFRNEIIDNRSFWYLENLGSKIYLHKNYDMLSDFNLSTSVASGTIMTFEYVVSGGSRYIIIDNASRNVTRNVSVYKEMFDFLMKNVDKIGHVDDDGSRIEKDPIVLFRPLSKRTIPLYLSHLPVWIFIENLLSVVYDFDAEDVLLLKGQFSCDEPFLLIQNKEDMVDKIGDVMELTDDKFPIIAWNTRVEESALSELV